MRYYGAYSHRFRARIAAEGAAAPSPDAVPAGGPDPVVPAEPGSALAKRRSAWARVLKQVFEVDPLLCPRRKTAMQVVAWITQRDVIDRILDHRRHLGLESPFDAFEARGPPLPD